MRRVHWLLRDEESTSVVEESTLVVEEMRSTSVVEER